MRINSGFTLAEVLITLGIVGVVAAMTLPALIQNHRKIEATSRLKKFYSAMSQAILMAENDYGPATDWDKAEADLKDEDGNTDYEAQAEACWNFWTKYLAPYIKYLKAEKGVYDEDGNFSSYELKVIFSDGSSMTMHNGSLIDLLFDINGDRKPNESGRDIFRFLIKATTSDYWFPGSKKVFGTYENTLSNSRTKALNKCKTSTIYCSALLWYDNWEFKEDYPYKL